MIIDKELEKQAIIRDMWLSTLTNLGYTNGNLRGRYVVAYKNIASLPIHSTAFIDFANAVNTLDLDRVGTWVDDELIHIDLVYTTNLKVLAQLIGIFKGEQAIYDRLEGEAINL